MADKCNHKEENKEDRKKQLQPSLQTRSDTGQMDKAFGCLPQAFKLCYTCGIICSGKVAFNRRTQNQPEATV